MENKPFKEFHPSDQQKLHLNRLVDQNILNNAFKCKGVLSGSTVLQMIHNETWNDSDVDLFFETKQDANEFIKTLDNYKLHEKLLDSEVYKKEDSKDINVVVINEQSVSDLSYCFAQYNGNLITCSEDALNKSGEISDAKLEALKNTILKNTNETHLSFIKIASRVKKYENRGFKLKDEHLTLIDNYIEADRIRNNVKKECWNSKDYFLWKRRNYTSHLGFVKNDKLNNEATFISELDLTDTSLLTEDINDIIDNFPNLKTVYVNTSFGVKLKGVDIILCHNNNVPYANEYMD